MNTENSWSRCAKEFSSLVDEAAADGAERLFSREFLDSRIDTNNKRKFKSSKDLLYRKNAVATDVALANIEEIESTELVSRWLADGIRTPPNYEQDAASQSTTELISGDLEKSPVINCRPRSVRSSNRNKRRQNLSPDLKKSPVIGGSRLFKKRRKRFDLSKKGMKKEDRKCLNVDRSSIIVGKEKNQSVEKIDNVVRKIPENISSCGFLFVDCNRSTSPTVNEKRILSSFNFEAVVNGDGDLRGFREREDFEEVVFDTVNENNFEEYEDDVLSQDLFDDYDEPKETEKETDLVSRLGSKNCSEDEEILGDPEPNYNSTKEYNLEKDSCKIELASGKSSSSSFIQDTEDLFPLPVPEKRPAEKKGEEELFVIDSELSQVKTEFVQDTEKIDYDTSSDSNKSDRTVSDIIEEPLTQDCIKIYEPKIDQASNSLINSVSKLSSKVSGTISSLNISVENTPPKEQQSFTHIPELNFSLTKKKKSRVKKGSLSARLRNLVESDISSVRLWRHQMSHDPIFQNSSTPFTILSVIDHSVQCDINFYRSKVIEDPFDLLKVYSNDLDNNGDCEKGKIVRNIVVITRSEFTGKLIMPTGTIFNLYTPWKIYNSCDNKKLWKRGDLMIQALYFKIISIAGKFDKKYQEEEEEQEKIFNRSDNAVKISPNSLKIITNEYNCPCLINGKIDDSCKSKFTDNQKVNIMNVILYNK